MKTVANFFLHQRIFFHLDAASQVSVLPSGVIPNESGSGGASRLSITGVDLGLGRISVILCRMFFVKI
jgi:hypothetical protein